MNKILTLILLFIVALSFAAEKEWSAPDFKEINSDITNYNSHFYYPSLLKRFCDGDTTMTDNELQHLYFGYTFQEDYDPYRDIKKHTEKIGYIYTKEVHSPAECDTIIKYAKIALADFPFELRQMNLMAYAYRSKGDEKEAAVWTIKMRRILNTILHSGNGLSPESAWHVISPVHAYDVVYCLGLNPSGYTFVEPMYDFIEVGDNPEKVEGYYFNVSRIIKEYFRKH